MRKVNPGGGGVNNNKSPPVLTLMHVGMVRQLLPESSNVLDQMTVQLQYQIRL